MGGDAIVVFFSSLVPASAFAHSHILTFAHSPSIKTLIPHSHICTFSHLHIANASIRPSHDPRHPNHLPSLLRHSHAICRRSPQRSRILSPPSRRDFRLRALLLCSVPNLCRLHIRRKHLRTKQVQRTQERTRGKKITKFLVWRL